MTHLCLRTKVRRFEKKNNCRCRSPETWHRLRLQYASTGLLFNILISKYRNSLYNETVLFEFCDNLLGPHWYVYQDIFVISCEKQRATYFSFIVNCSTKVQLKPKTKGQHTDRCGIPNRRKHVYHRVNDMLKIYFTLWRIPCKTYTSHMHAIDWKFTVVIAYNFFDGYRPG